MTIKHADFNKNQLWLATHIPTMITTSTTPNWPQFLLLVIIRNLMDSCYSSLAGFWFVDNDLASSYEFHARCQTFYNHQMPRVQDIGDVTGVVLVK